MSLRVVVDQQVWRAARIPLLAEEKELTRHRDAVAAARRKLPMLEITKDYRLHALDGGRRRLLDLLEGGRQLLVSTSCSILSGKKAVHPGGSALSTTVTPAYSHGRTRGKAVLLPRGFDVLDTAPAFDSLPVADTLPWRATGSGDIVAAAELILRAKRYVPTSRPRTATCWPVASRRSRETSFSFMKAGP
jgi:hypothetical protein